jgi:hypothetical protein
MSAQKHDHEKSFIRGVDIIGRVRLRLRGVDPNRVIWVESLSREEYDRLRRELAHTPYSKLPRFHFHSKVAA